MANELKLPLLAQPRSDVSCSAAHQIKGFELDGEAESKAGLRTENREQRIGKPGLSLLPSHADKFSLTLVFFQRLILHIPSSVSFAQVTQTDSSPEAARRLQRRDAQCFALSGYFVMLPGSMKYCGRPV